MNGPQAIHPDQQQLTDFGLGKLDPDEASEIEEHLANCETCADTLLNLKDDTFAGLVRQADVPSELAATDGDFSHSADTAQTILVQSGDPVDPAELPAELQDHPRYRIVDLIGRGGMGDVYRAEHKLMNRSVAVKLINWKLINHPQAVDRFRREVQAAAQLAHPNIVTAYDAEQAGDVHFLVMEYVEGTDLASLVKRRGPFSVQEACEIIRQAAEGLQHAHEVGMVHRDIKPHNLMISSGASGQSIVKILDFGLAGFATEAALFEADVAAEKAGEETVPLHLTTIGSVMGTPDYISPEQAKDAHTADIRADIYSLGCTLCFLLTGEPPFKGDNVMEKLKSHIEDAPPALDENRDDVPPELVAVIHKMLAKDPAERYQTPAEVVHALESIDDDFGVELVSLPKQEHRPRWPGWAKVAVGFLFTILLGVVLYIATDTGKVVIDNKAGALDGAKVVLLKDGKEYVTIDLDGSPKPTKIRAGEYQVRLRKAPGDVEMNVWTKKANTGDWGEPENHESNSVVVYRGGGLMIEVSKSEAMPPKPKTYPFRRLFKPTDAVITKTGMTQDQGGWKITAIQTRTVRLFEVKDPQFAAGQVTYRAKIKTENVQGRAYLEMWLRFPGQGESFSKGFHNALSGTNDWAEYEIPFFLKEGEVPDLAKLNLAVEGIGTVWIKDVELLGRTTVSPKDQAADMRSIQGTWKLTSVIENGEAQSRNDFADRLMAFTGDRFTGLLKRQSRPGKFTLSPSTNPKQIDLHFPAEGKSSIHIRGIYQLEADKLTIFMASDYTASKRPTDFKPAIDDGRSLLVLKRMPDHDLLQGAWKAVALEGAGQIAPKSAVKNKRLVFKGDEMSRVGKTDELRPYRLNPKASPKEIDIGGSVEGQFSKGIYMLDADTLKICFSQQTKDPRPKGFDTEGTRYFSFTFEREGDIATREQ